MTGGNFPVWIKLVPNTLSVIRLALAATFWAWPPHWRVPIVIMAGLSDFVDGFIARRFHASSWAGGLLDAVADKAFVLSVLLTLMAEGTIAGGQMALLLARDVVVIVVAGYAAAMREWAAFRQMPSRPLGKLTTALIFVYYVCALVWSRPEQTLDDLLFWPAGICSALAGADYLGRFLSEHRLWKSATKS
jgi:phosphatidylglycerophosphate synthase